MLFRRVDFEHAKVHWIVDVPAIRETVIADMRARGHPPIDESDEGTHHKPTSVVTYDAGGSLFLNVDKWITLDAAGLEVGVLDSHVPDLVGVLTRGNSARVRSPGYVKLHGAYYITVLTADQARALLASAKEWMNAAT